MEERLLGDRGPPCSRKGATAVTRETLGSRGPRAPAPQASPGKGAAGVPGEQKQPGAGAPGPGAAGMAKPRSELKSIRPCGEARWP